MQSVSCLCKTSFQAWHERSLWTRDARHFTHSRLSL